MRSGRRISDDAFDARIEAIEDQDVAVLPVPGVGASPITEIRGGDRVAAVAQRQDEAARAAAGFGEDLGQALAFGRQQAREGLVRS